jgi:hypothetical protein
MKIFSTLIAAVLLATATARADNEGALMRAIAAKHSSAVVTISLVLRSGDSDEQRELEAEGLVIDKTGLIVTTNTAVDPTSLMAAMGGATGQDGGGAGTNVVGAKVLLPQGGEIPARVVLRDRDRNLAFLRPARPFPADMTFLDFKTAKATALLGDQVYLLGRFGRAASRKPSVRVLRITGALTKPRVLYAIPNDFSLLGQAAFNEQGNLVGLVSLRAVRSSTTSFNNSDQLLTHVIPAADVWEIAAQAPSK